MSDEGKKVEEKDGVIAKVRAEYDQIKATS